MKRMKKLRLKEANREARAKAKAESSAIEKREREAYEFTVKLNQKKKFFEGFARKFEVIAEMDSAEEQSIL